MKRHLSLQNLFKVVEGQLILCTYLYVLTVIIFINSIFILTQTLVTFSIFLHLLLGHFTEFEG